MEYYRVINQMVNERAGGVASAKLLLVSLNFEEIKHWTEAGDWIQISAAVIEAPYRLEVAGADCLLIAANTMHKIAGEVQLAVKIPKYTMELDFYIEKLASSGIETIIPDEVEREMINSAIYEEMPKG